MLLTLSPAHTKISVLRKLAALCRALVVHERLVARHNDSFQFVPLDPVAAPPAALEIGRLVDAVVIGAGEAKIVRECILDALAIVRQIRSEDIANDLGAGCHSRILLRKHRKVRLGLPQHTRKGRPRLQAREMAVRLLRSPNGSSWPA